MTPEQVSNITYAILALAVVVSASNIGVIILTAWLTSRRVSVMLALAEKYVDGWQRAADAEASKSAMAAEYVGGMEQIVQSVVALCGRLAPRVGALAAEVDELGQSVSVMGMKVETIIERAGTRPDSKSKGAGNA
jgi:hypothetical protein